jgi:hypothetical protein
MEFVSQRDRRMAVRAHHAKPEARHILKHGRPVALILSVAAAAAVAVPASASASASASTTGASPVVGHVYVDDNTTGTNTIGAFPGSTVTLAANAGLPGRPCEGASRSFGRRGLDSRWGGAGLVRCQHGPVYALPCG